jgi:uncharacterized protein YcbX
MDINHKMAWGPIVVTLPLRFPVGSASPAPSFVDYAPMHILTTATMSRLAKRYPSGDWHVARFRPNVLIDTGDDDICEQDWIGRVIQVGHVVRLRIIDPCPRCIMTTLQQGPLRADPGIWRTLSRMPSIPSLSFRPGKALNAVAGIYAEVLGTGAIRAGDAVTMEEDGC